MKYTSKEAHGCTDYVAGRSSSWYHGVLQAKCGGARDNDPDEKLSLRGSGRGRSLRTSPVAQQRFSTTLCCCNSMLSNLPPKSSQLSSDRCRGLSSPQYFQR